MGIAGVALEAFKLINPPHPHKLPSSHFVIGGVARIFVTIQSRLKPKMAGVNEKDRTENGETKISVLRFIVQHCTDPDPGQEKDGARGPGYVSMSEHKTGAHYENLITLFVTL